MSARDARIASVTGRALAVPGDDIDTDRIMPARYLKCVTFESIGQYAFQDERFDPAGTPKPHPFNDPARRGASVLVVNKNFGCGSSREHAPQGLFRWGIRAILGESFAEIFAGNSTAIGMPTATASPSDIRALMDFAAAHPEEPVTLDLEAKRASFGGRTVPVEVREAFRKAFLDGVWDSTGMLLAGAERVRETAGRIPYLAWAR